MERISKFIHKYILFVVLILSIPAVWSLFVHGFYGASDDIHIAWLYEMDATLRAGQIPPRFVPDLSFGFGYPLFNFVFPLPYYIGEIFHLLGLSFVDSIKGVFILSIPLSMYFMYKFLKEFSSSIISLAGAVLYTFTPYRATDIFVRGAVGEILAFVFPPLVALSIVKLTGDKKISKVWIGILGLSSAALIMSHNIMAYMFMPFLLLLLAARIFYHSSPRLPLLANLAGFGLGLLISIYFWLPAMVESGLMKYDTVFNFADHFPTLKQLVTPYFGYGASVPGPGDGMSFFVGMINLILVFSAILIFVFRWKSLDRNKKVILIWGPATFLVSIFMMNFRSIPVWNTIPYLPYFQFPWRFLSLTAFVTPIFIIALDKFKFSNILGILILILAMAFNFKDFRPQDFLGRTDAYYIGRYIPIPVASSEYRQTSEEYLRLPKVTKVRPDKTSPDMGLTKNYRVTFAKDTVVNYYKYYFPGWTARVDGKSVAIKAGSPYGQISFPVSSGEHAIEIAFRETLFRGVLDVISLLSVIAAATIVVRRNHEK